MSLRFAIHELLPVPVPAAAAAILLASTGPVYAKPANECLAGVQHANGIAYPTLPEVFSCEDGDPACDADGLANGQCTFDVQACVNLPDVAGCDLRPIKKAVVKPAKLGIVVTPNAAESLCSVPTNVVVALKFNGKGKRRKPVPTTQKVRALAVVNLTTRDADPVKLRCLPSVPQCAANPDGGPSQLTVKVGPGGGDLDTGFSGRSHNFINVPNSTLKYCLTGCDGASTTQCHGSGPTGDGSINGVTFGPPLPLFSSNVAVCVVNRFQDPTIQTTVDLVTGAFDAQATPLNLLADTYQGQPNQVCPRCIQGKCDSGRRVNQPCTVDGTVPVSNPPNIVNVPYPVSRDCLPSVSSLLGTPAVSLPLTSATSTLEGNPLGALPCPGQSKHDECGASTCSVDCGTVPDFKGGINQTCCSNAQGTPCFPTDLSRGGTGRLTRTGSVTPPLPALPDPTYPKSNSGVLAAAFCIGPTGSISVDGTAGLAGPGAILLPGTGTFLK